MRLCAASRPVSSLPVSSSTSPGFHVGRLLARHRVQVHAPRCRHVIGQLRPVLQARRVQIHRPAPVQHKVRVPRRRAVGNHRHRQIGRVASDSPAPSRPAPWSARPAPARQSPAGSPCRKAPAAAPRRGSVPARNQVLNVDRVHQRLLGQQHRLLRRAADADAQHPRRTPSRAHRRHRLQHPLHNRIRRGSA